MEKTTNYIIKGRGYIVNITNVEILPYSNEDSVVPDKATIIGTDYMILDYIDGTTMNILASFDQMLDEMIYDNTELDESEISLIGTLDYLLLLHRSNIYIDNMVLGNDYVYITVTTIWLLPVYLQHRTVTFKNIDWNIHGRLIYSDDPMNLEAENIYVDYIKGYGGIRLIPHCNYPEAELESIINIKNITFYFSGERQTTPVINSLVEYRGSGSMYVDQYSSYTWIYEYELEAQIGIQANLN